MICKDMPNTSSHIKTINPLAVHDVHTHKVQSSSVTLKQVIYYKSLLKSALCTLSCLKKSDEKLSND